MQSIYFNTGTSGDPRTRLTTNGAVPEASEIVANPGESLASLTQRAYGVNSPALREKLQRANATLTGTIRVPR